jgi:hypothetical protein
MTTTTIVCDRCGLEIRSDRTALDVRSGPLVTKGATTVDLCVLCATAFVDTFLASVEPAAAEPVEVHP